MISDLINWSGLTASSIRVSTEVIASNEPIAISWKTAATISAYLELFSR